MTIQLLTGDARDVLPTLPADSVHCVVCSPPYYALRSYLDASHPDKHREIGSEPTPEAYLATMVQVFREVKRVLRPDGTCWVNMSGGYQNKQLDMMPARLALALQADDWILRSDIVWHKPGPMPESVRDRPTSAHEHVLLFSKSRKYYFDLEAIKEASGANCRNVWTIASYPFSGWIETSRRVCVAWDAAVDGKKRKASPDCPVHGDPVVRVASVPDDGHAADYPGHIARTDADLVQEQAAGCAPTVTPHEPGTEPSMLDLLGQSYSDVATLRSTRSHRTDRAPSTSPPCSASAQTGEDIGYTSESPSPSGSAERTPESSIAAHGLGDIQSSQTASRSADTSRESLALFSAYDPSHCTCEWYIEKTEKTSHFATYPPELVERCIKAGTSERGCCAACGKPWVRVVDKGPLIRHQAYQAYGERNAAVSTDQGSNRVRDGHCPGHYETTTTGWSAGCKCDAGDPTPCTVLDPFLGSGTTALVADRLQRHAIGIDLSLTYAEMAQRRIEMDCPLFTSWAPAEDPEEARMADLFEEAAE